MCSSAFSFLILRKRLGKFHPIYFTQHLFDVLIRSNDALRPYIEAARWIPLAIHPFVSVSSFIYGGMVGEDDPAYVLPLFLLVLC
jgi:hypothetical protein